MSSSPSWLSYLATHCPLSLFISPSLRCSPLSSWPPLLCSSITAGSPLTANHHFQFSVVERLSSLGCALLLSSVPLRTLVPFFLLLEYPWKKKKEKKKREKGKNRWEYYCNVSPFCCVLEDTYLEGGRNLNRGGRDARVLLLRIPVGTGRDIIDLGGFSFFFFFEDKRFLLDCALLICLMAE